MPVSKLEPILLLLDRKLNALDKPIVSRRDQIVETAIKTFACLLGLAAVTLLP
jgi:hypothetical protein